MIMKNVYFWFLIFLGSVNGWAYGVLMSTPIIMIDSVFPLVVFTTFSFVMWLIVGTKITSKLSVDNRIYD